MHHRLIQICILLAGVTATVLAATHAGGGDPIRGGRMWDRWWIITGDAPPKGNHPLYPATGTRSGPDTFRCNECHGWDYKGAAGAYQDGSHSTGVPGVLGSSRSGDELFELLKRGDVPQGHGYGGYGMTDRDIRDLVAFLQTELIDVDAWIDPTGAFTGDAARGEQYFTRGSGVAMQCLVCHGPEGNWRNFGTADSPKWIGTIADENPWELLHKIRFGQPGSIMPSWTQHGGTTKQAADIGAYAQVELPAHGRHRHRSVHGCSGVGALRKNLDTAAWTLTRNIDRQQGAPGIASDHRPCGNHGSGPGRTRGRTGL